MGVAKLFVYTGNGNLSGAHDFATATGKSLTGVSDYCDGSGWNTIVQPPGIKNYENQGLRLALGVNPAPDSYWTPHGGNTSQTWNNIVAGDYDGYYTQLAQYLASLNFTHPYLRPAWEIQSNQPWAPVAMTDLTNIAQGITHIAQVLKATLPNAVIDANSVWGWVGINGQQFNGQACIPNATPSIGIISCDMYGQSWDGTAFPPNGNPNNSCTTAQAHTFWADMQAGPNSPQSWATYGKSAGKAFSVPEVGMSNIRTDGHGLGDQPLLWELFAAFVAANNTAYISVYNFNDGSNNCVLTGGSFPNSLAAFKASPAW